MKKRHKKGSDREMRKAYDFSGGVRGKYAQRYAEGSNIVVLPPDLAKRFPPPNRSTKPCEPVWSWSRKCKPMRQQARWPNGQPKLAQSRHVSRSGTFLAAFAQFLDNWASARSNIGSIFVADRIGRIENVAVGR
jgi:hypothetical protein